MDETFGKLDKLIDEEMDRIRNLDDGEERNEAVKNLANLMKIKAESTAEKREKKMQVVDWAIKIGTVLLQVGIPAYTFSRYVRAGFEFEKEGTYTFNTFKNVLSKYKPF